MLGGQAGGGGGKGADVGKVIRGQLPRRFGQLQKPGHGAAAEDIPGTGGVDGVDLGAVGTVGRVLGFQKAAVRTQGDHGKRYTKFLQKLFGTRLRGAAPKELHLVVTDFDHVRLPQAPEDLLLGGILIGPQGQTQVGVTADELSFGFRVGHRLLGGGPGGLVRQAQGAKMEDLGIVNEPGINLFPTQLGIRAGLPGEGEGAVPVLVKGHESQGSEYAAVRNNALGFDSGLLQGG